jgi:LmbE family N-acetylglucosaminyl deacetylase
MTSLLRALIVVTLTFVSLAKAAPEAPREMDAAQIRLALEKLNVLGRVLYVAAHPDDENTNLIAYWANGALYDTAYLSLTRGDGGQNLIGPELREQLGVIRTQELLAARKIDHGRQFFTRANDFGFSKSADETLRIWDREKILADVVWVIRKFRPDLVVTRFPTEDSDTHGHHTASARLTSEAFKIAGDGRRFPKQLKEVEPWQPARLLWNSWQSFRPEKFDPRGYIALEAGGYQPLLGKSFPEIAAASRSMHKSQGFGAEIRRGERKEYFKFLDGKPVASGGIFEGVDTSWARVEGGRPVAAKINDILKHFEATQPYKSIPALLDLRRQLQTLGDDPWVLQKRSELDGIIGACLGLHLEAVVDRPMAQPGEKVEVQVEAINRSPLEVKLISPAEAALVPNELKTTKVAITLPVDLPYSEPYWLRQPGTVGTYAVAGQSFIGLPENPPSFPVPVALEVGGEKITYDLEPRFRQVDRVAGETSEPLVIAPAAFVQLAQSLVVFGSEKSKSISLRLTSTTPNFTGDVALKAATGWKVEPASFPVKLDGTGSEMSCTFKVTPPATSGEAELQAFFGATPAFSCQRIAYPHIDPQTLISPARARLVRAKIANAASKVGYIPGAGDAIPECLREIGSEVKVLNDADIKADNLQQFDAVVLGVRAYNVHPERIGAWSRELISYARNGGVVIVQYNTTPGPKPEQLPYPLQVSHDRVTDEKAEVRMLAPEHPALNFPNKITPQDFAGWVQERGLYFPDQWDAAWTPILSSNDPGEPPRDSGLLVAHCGQGWFIYTGYSWFRELPAGVPGAYRIFANLLSLGHAGK